MFWLFIKALKDPRKVYNYLRVWLNETNHFLIDLRDVLTTFSGVVSPYLAPVGVIAITWEHLVVHEIMAWYFGMAVIITLELMGFSITEMRLKIMAHNQENVTDYYVISKKTGKKQKRTRNKKYEISEQSATSLLWFYIAVVQAIIWIPSVHFGDPFSISVLKSFIGFLSLLGSNSAAMRLRYEAAAAKVAPKSKKVKAGRKGSVSGVSSVSNESRVSGVSAKKEDGAVLKKIYTALSTRHQRVYWAYVERPDAQRKEVGEAIGVTGQRVTQILKDLQKEELVKGINGTVKTVPVETEPIPVWEGE